MKIGVVGCGALGSYYGGLLCREDHETHFLLRSDFHQVKEQGVHIESPNGDFTIHPHAHQNPSDIGPCDLVLIGLKTTANDQFPKLIPPLVGTDTLILTLQNGLGNEAALTHLFPPKQILGGLCFVCLNRISPGHIRHMGHGLIVLGEWTGPAIERTLKLVEAFNQAGIPCKSTDKLPQAHWEKLMWNIPFNGLGVAGLLGHAGFESDTSKLKDLPIEQCLDANSLLSAPKWESRVKQLMDEVRSAAGKIGYEIDAGLADQLISRTRTMGPYKASTLIDYEKGYPLEMDSLFREPLRQAREASSPTPLLDRLVLILEELQGRQDKRDLST